MQHGARLGQLAVLLSLGFGPGCAYPTDTVPFPPAQAAPAFALVTSDPADGATGQPLNRSVRLSFSDMPDPQTIRPGPDPENPGQMLPPGIILSAKQKDLGAAIEINLVDREVVLRPPAEGLDRDSDYTVEFKRVLRALSGSALTAPQALHFRTGTAAGPVQPPEPRLRLGDILGSKGLLRATCSAPGACHAPSGSHGAIRGLDFTQADVEIWSYLTGTVAHGTPEGLLLVKPGAPEQSYLLRKLLGSQGFTRIEGNPMPPFGGGLDKEVLLAIQSWIRQGAPQ